MSDQVIRYESKQQYLDYVNHRRHLATGVEVDLPDWEREGPDAFWDAFHVLQAAEPLAVFEQWTILLDEDIDPVTGERLRQRCKYVTLKYNTIEEGRASRKRVREQEWKDPGVPVSTPFKSAKQAERYRAHLMQGDTGAYYDIKHRTQVAVIDSNVEVPAREIKDAE